MLPLARRDLQFTRRCKAVIIFCRPFRAKAQAAQPRCAALALQSPGFRRGSHSSSELSKQTLIGLIQETTRILWYVIFTHCSHRQQDSILKHRDMKGKHSCFLPIAPVWRSLLVSPQNHHRAGAGHTALPSVELVRAEDTQGSVHVPVSPPFPFWEGTFCKNISF